MPNYKILFARNTILSVDLTELNLPHNHISNVHYRYDPMKHTLVSAIVKSDTVEEARAEGEKLLSIFQKS